MLKKVEQRESDKTRLQLKLFSWIIKHMLTEAQINKAVEKIVSVSHPLKVILFGSYARGRAGNNSDLDLMVITPNISKRGHEMVQLREAIGFIGVGVDVLVYSNEEFAERADWCSSPVYWAIREGKVLYDAQKRS